MNYKIQIVTESARRAVIYDSYEEAEAAGFMLGHGIGGSQLRSELVGKPKIERLHGPMWGGWRDANGEGIYFNDNGRDQPDGEIASYSPSPGPVDHYLVRYEDVASYEVLSR